MSDSAVNLWQQVLVELQKSVPGQSLETWLRPLRALSLDNSQLLLEAPNAFIEEWVREHYLEQLLAVVTQLTTPETSVVIRKSTQEVKLANEPVYAVRNNTLSPEDTYLNPKYKFENYVVGPGCRFAHAASLAVAQSPAKAYNPLFIYGGVGLGKTHLLQAIGHLAKKNIPALNIFYGSCEKFTNQLINAIQNQTTLKFRNKYRNVDILLLDDIQFLAGKESTQEEFFHTFNTLYDAHKQIVISSDSSPKEIPGLEERLISRFEWGIVTDIQPPDLETRTAILRKKAEKEALPIPEGVIDFLAVKIRWNVRELEGALIRLVAYASLVGTPITTGLAEESLKDLFAHDQASRHVSVDLIQRKVCEYFDLSVSDMKIKKRTKTIVYPRQIAMFLARELTECSLPEIGDYFGGRDHTTVLHAINVVENHRKTDINLQKLLEHLKGKIREDK